MPVLRSHADLLSVAGSVASAKRELIFTTVTMDRQQIQLVFLRQWLGHLGARARNVLLVGANEATCAQCRAAALPCFVDEVAPAQRGKQNGFGSQVTLKWWYAMALSQAGYHLVFSDPDIVWLRDPFQVWDRTFDFQVRQACALAAPTLVHAQLAALPSPRQGLSDIRSPNVTVQRHHEITCMRPWMENMYEHGRRSVYPCQSTGLWYSRSTQPTLAFLQGLHRYVRARPNEWVPPPA